MKPAKAHKKSITVLGAGIVGVTTALTLQRNGYQVILIDKKKPAQETSFGNAGLLATSTLVPLNNPGLLLNLPDIILKRSNYVNYDWRYLLNNSLSFLSFLSYCRDKSSQKRAQALKTLIYPSIPLHQQWLSEAGELSRLRDRGWLKLYSSKHLFDKGNWERQLLKKNDVKIEKLDTDGIQALEPHLPDIYCRALWVRDCLSLDNPEAVCQSYFKLFMEAGGKFQKTTVKNIISNESSDWEIQLKDGDTIKQSQVVVCLGPWTMDFLKLANIKIPLIYERGAHRIFEQIENQPVTRPILDTDTGYLISPMEGKYRMTCGVYLADHNRPYNWKQLNYSEQVARTRFPLGDIDKTSKDWNGCRTALPDYLPIIGQTKRPGLWVNAGHHHIGLTMAPASAKLLSDMISKNELQLNSPYSPLRF